METVAFFSGHLNSAAMVARLIELGKTPDYIVYADTGLEFPQVYEFMETFQKKLNVEVLWESVIIANPRYRFENFMMEPWCRGKLQGEVRGVPRSCSPCWHNRNVKQPIFMKYEKLCDISYTGFTYEEHKRNLKQKHKAVPQYPLQEWKWFPEDCLKYLNSIGLHHPLYEDYGFKRLGCAICPYQKDESLYLVWKHFPEIWEIILDFHDKSPAGFRPHNKKDVYTLQEEWEREEKRNGNKKNSGC